MKITLPKLDEGQTGWSVYVETPVYETPPDTRGIYTRTMYKTLIYLHDKAELVWRWCYRKSRKYEAPQSRQVDSEFHLVGESE